MTGDEGMVLGHVRRVADPVDAGGRGVDEPPHAHMPRLRHQRLEAVVVDGAAQRRVQLEAGIVRDAGEVDHRVHSPEALLDRHRVAQVPLDQLEGGMTRQHVLAEEEEVDHADPVAPIQQLGHQDGADVAAAAGDQHRLAIARHLRPPAPRTHA
jgi:hypothetical protein